jgi:type II secretory pathway component GspD/PulD (secretin)
VLVKEGGTVAIGGVTQTQNNIAVEQVPLLSIPFVGKYFQTYQRQHRHKN